VRTEFDAAAGTIRVRIKDSGPGVAADVLPQIFEPFFTTKESQHRTGLGLAVARNIVEQHGGSIVAASVAGRGAEFITTLPLEAAVTPRPVADRPAEGNGGRS
jgi:signal transduction histidine kinase